MFVLKKSISFILIFLILFQSVFFGKVSFSAGTIDVSSFALNGLSSININPGDSFNVLGELGNSMGEDIKNVFIDLDFGTDKVLYDGTNHKTYVGSNDTNNPLSQSYFSNGRLQVEITNSTYPTIGITFSTRQAGFKYISGTTGFSVSPDISTGEITAKMYFTAKKVSDDTSINSVEANRTININVKPHILEYYFEKSDGITTTNTVQGSDAESINLVLEVKDYNGCGNIAGGSVTADLSDIGLTSSEILTYYSCDVDGKTAIFKKTGITTNYPSQSYTFTYNDFTAIDENGNKNNPYDAIFGSDNKQYGNDKIDNLNLTIVAASAPNVTLLSVNNKKIGGPNNTQYTLSFSGSQSGSGKVILGGDGTCQGGTILYDWFDYPTSGIQIDKNIDSSLLVNGSNSLYACIKNSGGNIGSINFNIIKDTTAPSISNFTYMPSIITNNPNISFICSEDGDYRIVVNSYDSGYIGVYNGVNTTASVDNSYFNFGANPFTLYCRDEATNEISATGTINKVPPTPDMGPIINFSDNDNDYNGLDGRDLSVAWTVTSEILNTTNFETYRIYLLPSNVVFNTGSQTYVGIINDRNISSWFGNQNIIKDSLGQNLVSGGSYKVCMAIMGSSGNFGTESCSSPAILTSDIIQNAKVLSARFTSNTNLELTTDATLDTDISSHSGNLVSYVYNSSTITGGAVSSINGTKINITIPALNNIGATANTLIVQTGALHSAGGGYNNYFSSGSLVIKDAQSPTVTGFANNTTSVYNNFFSGSIDVAFTFAEQMKDAGGTKISFDRTSGNTSVQKTFYLTDSSKLTIGAHNQTLTLSGLLVSGTAYNMTLIGQDLAGNVVNSSPIVVKFDNIGPTSPVLVNAENTSNQTPTLTWNASSDDSGNGSGIKEYIIKIYNSSDCSGSAIQTLTSNTTSKSTNTLTNGTYSWNVYALDNMGNIGTTSSCDSFLVDTTIPTISGLTITDTNNNNSTTYTKIGNIVKITANLTNTDISHIKADLSALTGNASHTGIVCGAPGVVGISCNYSSGIVEYSFAVGLSGIVSELVRQVKLMISNISEVTFAEKFASITVDNTSPTQATFSSPISQTYGGNTLNIAWSGISDTNLDKINISYSTNGGSNYISVYTGANISPYIWDISALNTGNNYKIKITSYDKSGNTSSSESSLFSLDKSNPTISAGVFLTPITSQYVKGNAGYTLTWNTSSITDNETLPSNPITLEYSLNNGSTWTVIGTGITNSGSYVWNIGNQNSTQALLRMKVRDNVGNESNYVNSSGFTIDSQNPAFSFTTGTPPNGGYINAEGFEVLGIATDNIGIDSISYTFKRTSDNMYWNGTGYTGTTTWNTLASSVNTVSYNLNTLLVPTISDGATYDFTVKTFDRAGNQVSSTTRQFIGDITNPNISITTLSGSYFSGSLNIAGTSSDAGAGVSSVKISIKKGTQYWNGSNFVSGEQILSTTTSNNYANWNYDFSPSLLESDGENYEVVVYAYDKSYKVNNTSSGTINIILDKTGPVIGNDIFTFTPSGFYAGGSSFDITWNPAKINTTGAEFSHIKLEYNNGGNFITIVGNTENDGVYNFNLPTIDNDITIVISAYDNLGNVSNSVASSTIFVDSTPPQIQKVETMDMSANGQIDALKVTMSENIKDSTININNFNIDGTLTPTSWETGNSINDNIFILKFSDIGDTSTTPTLSYTKGSLTDIAGKFLENVSGFSSLDTASPRILNAEIFANNSGIFNKIDVNFSENISSSSDVGAFSLNNGLSISSVSVSGNKATLNLNLGSVGTNANGYTLGFSSNTNWKDLDNNEAGSLGTSINLIDKAKPVLVSAILKDTNYIADKLELIFSENLTGITSGFSINSGTLGAGVLNNDKITFGVSGISGTKPNINITYSGSLEDNFSNTLDNFSNLSVIEKISPKLENVITLDQNGNGKIDGILLGFSEELNGNFADILVSVNGYTTNGYTMSGSQEIIASIGEKQVYDTDSIPNVNIVSNNGLKDINNNVVLSQNMNAQDKVGPVIVGARYEPSTHKVFMNFSENINASDFIVGNFVLQNAGSYTINSVNIGEKSITLSGENINYSTSMVSFVSNSVRDDLGNKQSSQHFVSITAPIIINEIMISNNPNNNYIELHNLSQDVISLSGWTIAGITIPSGQSIGGNGYYLISASDISTSNINVSPDFIGNIVFSGNEIVLNNGTIDIDKASLTTGLGDNSIPSSIERKTPVSNGLLANSWYRALVSNGFDNNIPLGTPKTVNIFDTIAPSVQLNMTDNMLLPIGMYDLKFTFSDNILINTGSINFALEKWNGSTFANNTSFSSGIIDVNQANYSLNNIPYGRYKALFSIQDSAGNTTNLTKEFYVDDFSFSIDNTNIDLGVLESGNTKISDVIVGVEVKTIGAGFEILHNYDTNELGDWDGNLGYGACEGTTCSLIENYKNKSIKNQVSELQTSGELKTYNYKIKYGSLVNSLKEAGKYQVENKYSVKITY